MKPQKQARKLRYSCLLFLVASLLSTATIAQERLDLTRLDWIKLPDHDRSLKGDNFESKKFSKHLKVKGWRLSEDIYMGGVKVDGQYGPGIVLDKGGYVWGLNHERIQFQLRF